MKVVLTGAGGFFGTHLRGHLEGQGVEVHALTLNEARGERVRRIKLDTLQIRKALADIEPDYLLHLAGAQVAFDASTFTTLNVLYASVLIDAMKGLTRPCPMLLVGTAAEYGSVSPNDLPVVEETPTRPYSLYGASKLAQTHLGLVASRELPITVVRPFNLIGPGMPANLFVGNFARQIRERKGGSHSGPISTGDLTTSRDFFDVQDAARLCWKLVSHPGAYGQVFNLCSGKAHRVGDVAERLILLSGMPLTTVMAPSLKKDIDIRTHYGSAAKLERLVGKLDLTPFETSLGKIASFYFAA